MNGPTRSALASLAGVILSGVIAASVQAQHAASPSPAPPQPAAPPGGGQAIEEPVLKNDVIDSGRSIFHGAGTCHACHGDQLQGGALAPSLRGPKWRHIDGSYGDILHRIEKGQTGTLMTADPGGINDTQAVEVATYIWAVSQGKAKP